MLHEYFKWWIGQMLDLIPPKLRESFIPQSDSVLIEPLAGTIEAPTSIGLRLLRNRQSSDLGRYACDPNGLAAARRAASIPGRQLTIRLILPATLMLQKELALPLGAERELHQVLSYEMDRETPFSADEVWWNFAIRGRDRARGKLLATVWLVPKALLAPFLSILSGAGITPSTAEIAAANGGRRSLPLAAGGASRHRWATLVLPLAAAACLVLALVASALPFIRQSYAFSAETSRIDMLKPTVDQVEALRKRLAGGGASEVLKAERERVGDALTVLATATRLLPDDTYLTDLTMQQRHLTLNGQSVGPAKLIPVLANDPVFKNPALGTSTHAEGSRTDVFSITSEARP